jgi:hypothetical protein
MIFDGSRCESEVKRLPHILIWRLIGILFFFSSLSNIDQKYKPKKFGLTIFLWEIFLALLPRGIYCQGDTISK